MHNKEDDVYCPIGKIELPEHPEVDLLKEFRVIFEHLDPPKVKRPSKVKKRNQKAIAKLYDKSPYGEQVPEAHPRKVRATTKQMAERKFQALCAKLKIPEFKQQKYLVANNNSSTTRAIEEVSKYDTTAYLEDWNAELNEVMEPILNPVRTITARKPEPYSESNPPLEIPFDETKAIRIPKLVPRVPYVRPVVPIVSTPPPVHETTSEPDSTIIHHEPSKPQPSKKIHSPEKTSPVRKIAAETSNVESEKPKDIVENQVTNEGRKESKSPQKVKVSPSKMMMASRKSPRKKNSPNKLSAAVHSAKEENKQRERLHEWLNKSSQKDETTSLSNLVSVEMEERIHNRLYDGLGSDMWTDDVASKIAQDHGMDTVFGSGSVGRAAKFDATKQTAAPAPEKEEDDPVIVHANNMAQSASELGKEGYIEASMACYEDSVKILLESKPLESKLPESTGFNYSTHAHSCARKIQKLFRWYCWRRNWQVIPIQRMARGYIARRKIKVIRKYLNINASYIQGYYLKRLLKRHKAATRIQAVMRSILCRKNLACISIQRRVRGIQGREYFRETFRIWQYKMAATIQLFCRRKMLCYRWELKRVIGRFSVLWTHKARYLGRLRSLKNRELTRLSRENKLIAIETEHRISDYKSFLKSSKGKKYVDYQVKLITAEKKRHEEYRENAKLTEAERKKHEAHELFETFDLDGSGSIDHEEAHFLLEELGLSLNKKELQKALKELDSDGSGDIDFAEFYEWYFRKNLMKQKGKGKTTLAIMRLQKKGKHLLHSKECLVRYAMRKLIYNETLLIEEETRSTFREQNPPRYLCTDCNSPFALYYQHWHHQKYDCNKRLLRKTIVNQKSDVKRQAAEDAEVEEKQNEAMDHFELFITTKEGKAALAKEVKRIKELKLEAKKDSSSLKVRNLFNDFDTDGSDSIDAGEFHQLVRELGIVMSKAEISKTLKELDDDDSGEISFDEFEKWFTTIPKQKNSKKQLFSQSALKGKLFIEKASGKQVQAQAMRYMRARDRYLAKQRAINDFRLQFPPPFECQEKYCRRVFCTEAELKAHEVEANDIHANLLEQLKKTLAKLGFENGTAELDELFKTDEDLLADKNEFLLQQAARQAKAYLRTDDGELLVVKEMQRLQQLEHALNESCRGKSPEYKEKLVIEMTFDMFDLDGGGTLCEKELKFLLESLSQPSDGKSVSKVMAEIDQDQSGEVGKAEFVQWFSQQKSSKHDAAFHFKMQQLKLKNRFENKSELRKKASLAVICRLRDDIIHHHLDFDIKESTEKKKANKRISPEGDHWRDAALSKLNAYLKTKVGKKELKTLVESCKKTSREQEAAISILKSTEERAKLRLKNKFNSFDIDSSGSIDQVELRQMLIEMGVKLSEEEFLDLLCAVDLDQSGEIEFEELHSWYVSQVQAKVAKEALKTTRWKISTTISSVKNSFVSKINFQNLLKSSDATESAKRLLLKKFLESEKSGNKMK